MDESPFSHSHSVLGIPLEFAFAVFALLVSVNMLYLDILVFGEISKRNEAPNAITIQPTPDPTADQSCPQACLTKIQEVSVNDGVIPTITPPKKPLSNIASAVKEFFVPFGSGSGSSTDWENVPGLETTIDTKNYPELKTVTFEATIRIPTGNQSAYVRLYNVTDKHPVWFSDISTEGGITKLVISSPIALDAGNKTYQVQLKTSLGYPSNIDQSRLRILTQ
ncbi:hypothetical protein A3A63_04440 [Candidatus Gottesmanbacteria bacterium RIFCSPLOWO2_01_FULL_46_9]|uniref:Uncharacterized protein n=1 Tax=Candidatus Gottesmanbacteria bacterium RIFCSPLOWO2_01_FULL_46_9 TaxID=1798394 RepID=A0A1F6B0S3_9BACT|nr:MAG: hypothetical protein A3A63_04440 [Candidatus Gottesmanbacteria bacterium RIFCSPLOWO2_01_FULL_46_9]